MRWCLITWTTHGAWLPGDNRGFRTRGHKSDVPPPKRYAQNQNVYNSRDWQRLLEYSKRISKREVHLDQRQQGFVQRRLDEIARKCGCLTTAIHVGKGHVHILANPRANRLSKLVQRFKGVTSRGLSEYGLEGRVWARGYHVRRIPDEDIAQATRYLLRHKNRQGMQGE